MTEQTPEFASASPFDGVDNFRDFGGYVGHEGRTVKRGLLYRSAHHGRATEDDLARLQALGIATIVDLRRPEERLRDPCLRWAAFETEVIDNDIGESPADAYEAYIRESDLSVESMRTFLVDYYTHAPFKARHIDLYSRYFEALAEGKGPVLIHCAAGKDRTGILAALTLHLLGVDPRDAMVDYLLTNDPARIERRAPLYTQYIEESVGRRPSEAFIRATLGVEALYLHTAFEAIKARHGSARLYLQDTLGVDAERADAIRHRLLE